MNPAIYDTLNSRLSLLRNHITELEQLLEGYRQAEQAVRESEERFRLLVEQVQDYAIFMLDPDGRIMSWNAGAERIKWYSTDEIIGEHFSRFYPPEDLAVGKPANALTVARTQGRFEDEDWRMRKDGSRFWANVVITALHGEGGELRGFATVTRDLTERKRAEDAREQLLQRERVARVEAERLARQIQRLQILTDATLAHLALDELLNVLLDRLSELLAVDTVAILLLTDAGDVLTVRAAKGLEGEVSQGVQIPLGAGFAGRIAAERRSVVLPEVDPATIISPVLREKGVRSLLGAPLLVENRLIGVVHVGSLTPRSFSEDDVQLLQLAGDRIALAIEHARSFAAEQAAHRQAEEALQLREQFLSLASHELKTPLTTLMGNLELIERRSRKGSLLPEREHNLARVSIEQGKRLTQLVNMMLDISRIQRGRLTIERQPVDLVALVRRVVEAIRPNLQQHRIELRVQEPQLLIEGDALRLQQVVENIIENAIIFSPNGGRITVEAERRDQGICLVIHDEGMGIPAADLPHIFESFYTIAKSSSEYRAGMGIGLYMVQEIVTRHEGMVEVQSEVGKGSTFTITLPTADVDGQ
ncbi:MAG: ATP-binding protein [Chloroflexota bacterium]|nr:ATP-binding protein [Chloroflexota bacterium]